MLAVPPDADDAQLLDCMVLSVLCTRVCQPYRFHCCCCRLEKVLHGQCPSEEGSGTGVSRIKQQGEAAGASPLPRTTRRSEHLQSQLLSDAVREVEALEVANERLRSE